MKFFAYLIFFITFSFCKANVYSLEEAINLNLAKVQITPNEKSTHYHSPLTINIENKSSSTFSIQIANGDVLKPQNDNYQRVIVTERLLVKLAPFETESKIIKGMCIDENKISPSQDINYVFSSKKIVEEAKKLAEFIEKQEYFEANAQFLMWDILKYQEEYKSLESFKIEDESIVALTKNSANELIPINFTKYDVEIPQKYVEFSGSFSLSLFTPKNIHIAMFNQRNTLVKELYKNSKTPVGETNLTYAFNSEEFNEDLYTIKLVMEGQIIMEREINLTEF